MVIKREKTTVKELGNGMSRRVLNRGGRLMLVEFTFTKDGIGTIHSHPHERKKHRGKKGRFHVYTSQHPSWI